MPTPSHPANTGFANAGFERVSVIGLGYVGLPTAAVMANRGLSVIGVDANPKAVERINRGEAHIVEPDLDILVRSATTSGNLRAVSTPEPANAFIVAVPTPFKENHEPDLAYVESAVRSIAPVLAKGNLVVLESTSPVGTTERMAAWLAELRPDLGFPGHGTTMDVHIAYSPERVLPGRVLIELVDNDRVIGGLTPACGERAKELYSLFVQGTCFLTTARTAELVKLSENAYRDLNIAFANELSLVCEKVGVNVWEAIELANRHPRVEILKPGPGVGGHCIAVDPWFIVDSARDVTPLIQAARGVNDGKPHHVAQLVAEAARGKKNPTLACLGLAYKADIDDFRESPSVDVITHLDAKLFAKILVVEPHSDHLPDSIAKIPGIALTDLDSALDQADIIVLLTDHTPFRNLERARLAGKSVIDTRGVWR
jgi:UDP-N-acetyl-D-mannosaminuronic acid dehydrogenase